MLNKLTRCVDQYEMLQKGDTLWCAVSGGADSMALLWSMYLLRDKLDIRLKAAHFNHGLRGGESDGEEAFVRQFCRDYGIPLEVGSAKVQPGKKGLEAAARDARYAFLRQLDGKVATAHTANDNAETLLMHMVRGTGLKGLGGISPVRGNLIRPMLDVTRQEVLELLGEYSIPFVEDSSNGSDVFLRNRLRHHVMPLLEQENPSLAENLSAAAQRLRLDEQVLDSMSRVTDRVDALRQMQPGIRSRVLAKLLTGWGVKEPEAEHLGLLEQLVFSAKPSARADFPGGVCIRRNYDILEKAQEEKSFAPVELVCPGVTVIPELGVQIKCSVDEQPVQSGAFAVNAVGTLVARPRLPGDVIRLPGGTKRLKELFIDRKIPAAQRNRVIVLCDEAGILGVQGIGANLDRAKNANLWIRFENI